MLRDSHHVRMVSWGEDPAPSLALVVDMSARCEIAKVLGTSCSSDCREGDGGSVEQPCATWIAVCT